MINIFTKKKHETAADIRARAAAINSEKEAELRRMLNEREVARVNERRKREAELDELKRRELELKRAEVERKERNLAEQEARKKAELDRIPERIDYLMTRVANLERLQDAYIKRLDNPKNEKEEATSWSRMITLDNQIESARREISKLEAVWGMR